MNDLVERLHDADANSLQRVLGSRIFVEAADRIEALERENASLRHDIERYQEMNAELHAANERVRQALAVKEGRAALREEDGK